MASINKAFIMGHLGQDPELRYTQSQMPVVTLSIATTEVRTTKEGQRQESTEWHRVTVWGKQAENCEKYLNKGRAVFVEGKIQTRSWDDKNGQKRYTTEIVANNVQFMPGGERGARPMAQDGMSSMPSYSQGSMTSSYSQEPSSGSSYSQGSVSNSYSQEPSSGSSYHQTGASETFPKADRGAPAPSSSGDVGLDDIPF